jgi:hypothetical protein
MPHSASLQWYEREFEKATGYPLSDALEDVGKATIFYREVDEYNGKPCALRAEIVLYCPISRVVDYEITFPGDHHVATTLRLVGEHMRIMGCEAVKPLLERYEQIYYVIQARHQFDGGIL